MRIGRAADAVVVAGAGAGAGVATGAGAGLVTAGAGAGVLTTGVGAGVTAGAGEDEAVVCDVDSQPTSNRAAAAAKRQTFKLWKDDFLVFIVGFIG